MRDGQFAAFLPPAVVVVIFPFVSHAYVSYHLANCTLQFLAQLTPFPLSFRGGSCNRSSFHVSQSYHEGRKWPQREKGGIWRREAKLDGGKIARCKIVTARRFHDKCVWEGNEMCLDS